MTCIYILIGGFLLWKWTEGMGASTGGIIKEERLVNFFFFCSDILSVIDGMRRHFGEVVCGKNMRENCIYLSI